MCVAIRLNNGSKSREEATDYWEKTEQQPPRQVAGQPCRPYSHTAPGRVPRSSAPPICWHGKKCRTSHQYHTILHYIYIYSMPILWQLNRCLSCLLIMKYKILSKKLYKLLTTEAKFVRLPLPESKATLEGYLVPRGPTCVRSTLACWLFYINLSLVCF